MVDRMMSADLKTTAHGNGRTAAEPWENGKDQETTTIDPAIGLFTRWQRAQRASLVLCRLQQRLERRILDAACPAAMDAKASYLTSYRAEVEAAIAALKLQDELPQTPARSLPGIVAKLEIIIGADREIEDPTDFPWPHIASILDDLKEIAGSTPLERPDRPSVQADCRRYQAIAADLVRMEKQTAELGFEQRPTIDVDTE